MWLMIAAMLLVPLVPAFGYVDPGTGSMIIQTVIAVVVGGAAFLGAFWRKLFRKRRTKDDDRTDAEDE
jgi:hypothetical protein